MTHQGPTVHELLDAERSVVVAIDLQGKLMDMVVAPPLVLRATCRLLQLADVFGVPVLLTEQYPEGLGVTHAQVRAAFDALRVPTRAITKTSFGCCGDDGFRRALVELRPSVAAPDLQVVVAGIEAHICVMQTVLALLAQGSQVHVCWECVSGRGEEYRTWALARMQQAGATITNHESVGFEWARHKDHAGFRAMNKILREGQIG